MSIESVTYILYTGMEKFFFKNKSEFCLLFPKLSERMELKTDVSVYFLAVGDLLLLHVGLL